MNPPSQMLNHLNVTKSQSHNVTFDFVTLSTSTKRHPRHSEVH